MPVAVGDRQGAAERAAEVGHEDVAAEGRIALAQRRRALRSAQESLETGSARIGTEALRPLTRSPAAQVGQYLRASPQRTRHGTGCTDCEMLRNEVLGGTLSWCSCTTRTNSALSQSIYVPAALCGAKHLSAKSSRKDVAPAVPDILVTLLHLPAEIATLHPYAPIRALLLCAAGSGLRSIGAPKSASSSRFPTGPFVHVRRMP